MFEVSRALLWEAIQDPHVIAKTLPGCDGLQELRENEYEGVFNIQIGPVQGRFEGRFSLSDFDPPHSYLLKLSGKGTPGFVDGEGKIQLDDGNGSTTLRYDFDVQVGGRVASVGQRLLDSSAKVVARQGLERLSEHINALDDAAAGEEPHSEPASQTEFASKVAWGVLADLMGQHRTSIVIVVSLAGLLLLFLILA